MPTTFTNSRAATLPHHESAPVRDPQGRLLPGHQKLPGAGRRRGEKIPAFQLQREVLAVHRRLRPIFDQLIARAEAGNREALLLLGRLYFGLDTTRGWELRLERVERAVKGLTRAAATPVEAPVPPAAFPGESALQQTNLLHGIAQA